MRPLPQETINSITTLKPFVFNFYFHLSISLDSKFLNLSLISIKFHLSNFFIFSVIIAKHFTVVLSKT